MNNNLYFKKTRNNSNDSVRLSLPKLFTIIYFIGIFIIPTSINAQQKPTWLNESFREMNYPGNTFLREFAFDNKSPDESVGEAIERISEISRANLSLSILSTIHSVIESYSQNFEQDGQHQYSEQFQVYSKSESHMVISGVNVETYFDEKDQMVYALAYANKYEVIGYYKALIQMELQKINSIVDNARKYEDELKKVSALEQYESAIPIFADIAFARGLLVAVDNVGGSTYMVEEINNMQQTITEALIRLSNAISIYIVSNEDLFGSPQNSIENGIKGMMSAGNFNFVDSPEDAEWILEINATAREYNKTHGIYFSYIDADVKLIRTISKANIYQDKFSVKGGHTLSFLEAARRAGQELSETIATAALDSID